MNFAEQALELRDQMLLDHHNLFLAVLDDQVFTPIPDGWSIVGIGAYRLCLRAPDGNVYKTDLETDGNEDEFRTYQSVIREFEDARTGNVRPCPTSQVKVGEEVVNVQPFLVSDDDADYDDFQTRDTPWLRDFFDAFYQGIVVNGVYYVYDIQGF